jgi:serine/threonine protein kinase
VRRDFFDKYQIQERMAEGGQGDVWKVWDYELRRCVAMKRLRPEAVASEPAVYRFLAEAQITAQLEHPGVLPIFDAGLDPDGRPFYTTQLLPGATLAELWRKVPDRGAKLSELRPALELLLRVCDVMAYAHSRGVIHRDLKPANVLVGAFGDVRVIDWGSAHVLGSARKDFEEPFVPLNRQVIQTDRGEAIWAFADSPLATAQAGQPITVLFMPPEILAGHAHELGPQTDVYSLGVMLYHLFAGRPPYSDPGGQLPPRAVLQERILAVPPAALRARRPGFSRDLAAICQKAMAHDQAARYASMAELADDLRAALEVRPVQARRPGPMVRLQKWVQRHPAYIVFAAILVAVISSGVSLTRGLRIERNVARQLTALRSAELASRSGQWREALKHWDQAESAGYDDAGNLALHRAEAWTVLGEPARARALLQRLARRSDPGELRGTVLLRLAEQQLFDQKTADQGAAQVREAMRAGLAPADLALAQGLIADSTPRALELFRQALQLNPYSHAAHRHSLGLEFLLGQRQEFQEHVRLFRILYPDDPAPRFLEASLLSIHGRLAEGEALLESLRDLSSPQVRQQLLAGLRAFASAASAFGLDTLLATNRPAASPVEFFVAQGTAFGFTGYDAGQSPLRIPHLPCVRQGVLAGNEALRQLAIPFIGDPRAAAGQLKASWQHHPEALITAMAGLVLDQRPAESVHLLELKAELFQRAADSPSLLPKLPRLCRFLAAQNQWKLANCPTPPAGVRQACRENLIRASRAEDLSAPECRACFDLAMDLEQVELARAFLLRWEGLAHTDPAFLRARVRLDLAAGALSNALQQLNRVLAQDPGDAWAKSQRDVALEKIGGLAASASASANTKPKP